jgi:hypothetical protein
MIDSIDILRKILNKNPTIESLSFYEFDTYKLIQNRINLIKPLDKVFSDALEMREIYKLPFWDSFNVSLFDQEIVDYEFLKEINFQNNPKNSIRIDRESFMNNKIDFEKYTGVGSLVNSKSSDLHIPLLDFHIPPSIANLRLCSNILNHLGLKGYILDSGKSYHFIGNEMIGFECLQTVLFNALLFSPIIDKSWIAHQLIQKNCCLRVTPKYGRLPYLVLEI